MSRILFSVLALAASLNAQAPAPLPRVPLPDWRTLLRGGAITPQRVCAIPLLNVLRSAPAVPMPIVRPPTAQMPTVRPRAGLQFPMQEVHVPAPACDNVRSSPLNEQNPARPH
jgi:hypothetical protein